MRKLVLLCLLLYSSGAPAGEYTQMLHKPYTEKVADIHTLYLRLVGIGRADSAALSEEVQKIKAFAVAHQDLELEREMDLFSAYFLTYERRNLAAGMDGLLKVITKAEEEKMHHIRLRGIRVLASRYWELLNNYEKAFEYYLMLDKELDKVTSEEYPDMVADLNNIAEAYYNFHDYTLAIGYLKKAITIPETGFNTLALANTFNTIGLCYQKLGDYKTANACFYGIFDLGNEHTKEVWGPIALGNIGNSHYLEQNFEEAIPLLEHDYIKAEEVKDYGLAAGALIRLADIYLQYKKYRISWEYIEKAHRYILRSGQRDRLRLLYPVMSKWYIANARKDLAHRYVDSAILANNAYYEKYSALKLLRADQTISNHLRNLEIAEIDLEKQKKIQERNALIVLVIFLFLGLIIFYFVYKKQQLSKKLRLKTAENKLQAARQELEIASVKLSSFRENIARNNQLIERLQEKVGKIEYSQVIEELQRSTILTEDDWITFQTLFDKAYPGFIYRTKEKYRELSQAEIRFLVLSRLRLSTREMASIQGISMNSVQVTRHRVRKKLSLAEYDSFEQLADKI